MASTKRKAADQMPHDNDHSPKHAHIEQNQPMSLEAAEWLLVEALRAADQKDKHLTMELAKKDREIEELKNKLKAALSTPEHSKQGISVPQGPDNQEVVNEYGRLCYLVTALVNEFFQGPSKVDPGNEKASVRTYFESLIRDGDYMSYLRESKHTFIEAVIWNKLIDALLGMPIAAFVEKSEAKLEATLKASASRNGKLPTYYALRPLMSYVLSPNAEGKNLWVADGSQRIKLINHMAMVLDDYTRQATLKVLKTRIGEIVDRAVTLASAMAHSRAYWVCDTKSLFNGFNIKTDSMEEVPMWEDDGGNVRVDLVVAPMLLKFGNSDGENYETRQVFKKARVVMIRHSDQGSASVPA